MEPTDNWLLNKEKLDRLKLYLDRKLSSSHISETMSDLQVRAFEDRIVKLKGPMSAEQIKEYDQYAKKHGSTMWFAIIFDEDDQPSEIYPLFELQMPSHITGYSHMNKDKQNVQIGLSIPEVAKQLVGINYGQQRMLVEILKLRERSPSYFRFPIWRQHTDDLRKLLETGWH